MRKTSLLFALLAACALASLPRTASAVDCVGAISLGETNAAYTTGCIDGHAPCPGALTIRGVVDCFSAPVLACAVAGSEYTIVYTGNINSSSVTFGVGPTANWNAYQTGAAGGTFTIYEDPTPDADPANPASYTDGAVFLTGTIGQLDITYFLEQGTFAYKGGNFDTGVTASFTGGSGYSCVSRGGAACPLRFTGGWNVTPGSFPAGYAAHVAGKMDVQCPTATEPGTIGRIKAQYR